ncbi:hornerin isoform X3 [Epinephelus moara]|uniref:hornerin isoform X3 n=1 Tax=Epinephelus moara TaxID=300413 RepID=UPI00214EBA3D|nr:hornerin isoform X3 [Epinephelus moara]
MTSQAEEEDDEEEEEDVVRRSRNRTKKAIPEGFVRNVLTDSDEEGQSVRGVELPNYPAPPKKLQPIQGTAILDNASSGDEDMSVQATRADSSQGRHSDTPSLSGLECASGTGGRETSTPGSRHAARGHVIDGYRSRSRSKSQRRHASRHRHRSGSNRDASKHRHRSGSNSDVSRHRHRSGSNRDASKHRHRSGSNRDASKHRHRSGSNRDVFSTPARSRCDHTSPPYHTPRPNAVTESRRWTFPLPWDVYQKKVLGLLVDLRNEYKTAQPASSAVHIERMETMEDFEKEEQHLCDKEAFDTLVKKIAKIGGKNTKDCIHKVLDKLFTNALMANFNMKGKGKKGKKPLETTKIYRAIQDGVMQFDNMATEELIRTHASEHLKHAPQRSGGGGFTVTQG